MPPVAYRTVRRLAKAGIVKDARLEKWRQRYGSADYRAATGVMRDVLVTLLADRYEEAIASVRCPVELVWGDADSEAPLEVAERIRAALPNGAELRVCAGTGHMTPLEAPAELRAADRAPAAGRGAVRQADLVAFAFVLGAATVGTIRWLRVAQREHYLAGSCDQVRRPLVAQHGRRTKWHSSSGQGAPSPRWHSRP